MDDPFKKGGLKKEICSRTGCSWGRRSGDKVETFLLLRQNHKSLAFRLIRRNLECDSLIERMIGDNG